MKDIVEKKNKIKIIIVGLTTGFLSGLFASGGGLIAVPAFTHILNKNQKEARAMTIFCILPMVIASLIFYNKLNCINYKMGIICGIGGLIGGSMGANLLVKMNDKWLQLCFIFFLIYSSILIFIRK